MKTRFLAVVAGTGLLLSLAIVPLSGHHAFAAEFDGTPNTLIRRGFTKTSLKPGTEISVDGYQAKDGARRANGRDLTLPDGRTLFLGSSGTGAPYDKK